MIVTPTQTWDRHSILAEIKRQFGSLRAFAATTDLPPANFSAALASPYPKADRLIAKGIDVPLHVLWPDRYDRHGNRKASPSSQARPGSTRFQQRGAA